jgi:protein-S-isoprenylcysteine O-methyltransferase Ste14
MGLLWFSWFQMCFTDPLRVEFPRWARYTGLAVFATGVLLFVVSHLKLKRFSPGDELVVGGIYSKIRNPIYLGFILWIVGFPIFMQSLITLLSAVFWIGFIISWKITEEKELVEKYPDYQLYKNKTWF